MAARVARGASEASPAVASQLHQTRMKAVQAGVVAATLVAAVAALAAPSAAAQTPKDPNVQFVTAAAADTSLPARELAKRAQPNAFQVAMPRDERGPVVVDQGHRTDGALQSGTPGFRTDVISAPLLTFEGAANADNPFLLAPPDPIGDVGPKNYVEMVNLTFIVFDKDGNRLLGPLPLGSLWADFDIPDCTDGSGDPVVLHDQLANRWILTQFTTRGPTFYNCVAVSATADPTGAYHRYAFSSGENFPDYPKYGVWPNAYFLSTREFAPDDSFAGVGAYALERTKMLRGDPTARAAKFLLAPGTTPYLPGDGLLPSDLDGSRRPPAGSPNYFVGTQDNDGPYGAPFDALNIFQFWVSWGITPVAAFLHTATVPVAEFDSIFPCDPPPNTRDCIPQPGTTNKIDILSYRQRPTWRLAYRNFGDHEALVTNQSVEARPGIAGVRWYEIRRPGDQPIVWQQGTYSPGDDTHRWMGSVAQDKRGNMAVGFSVSNGTTVFPGIRYTGRLAGDPIGQLPQGEQVLINGTGSHTVASRWGDYTSLNVDPTDDCTFWYVNQYIQTTGPAFWQTRIGAFRLPGCRR
jgi:hypothetical protein